MSSCRNIFTKLGIGTGVAALTVGVGAALGVAFRELLNSISDYGSDPSKAVDERIYMAKLGAIGGGCAFSLSLLCYYLCCRAGVQPQVAANVPLPNNNDLAARLLEEGKAEEIHQSDRVYGNQVFREPSFKLGSRKT